MSKKDDEITIYAVLIIIGLVVFLLINYYYIIIPIAVIAIVLIMFFNNRNIKARHVAKQQLKDKESIIEKIICGHKVLYIDETHKYYVDGKEVPSITQIVEYFSKQHVWDDYSKVSPEVLRNAANKGTKLHNEIEKFEVSGEKTTSQEFLNYLEIKEKYNFKVLENEQIVVIFCKNKPIAAGRFDMIIELDGKLGVLDVKRTYKMHKEKVSLQLNLYRIAYMQCNAEKNIELLRVVRLRNSIKQFRKIVIDENFAWKCLNEYCNSQLQQKAS